MPNAQLSLGVAGLHAPQFELIGNTHAAQHYHNSRRCNQRGLPDAGGSAAAGGKRHHGDHQCGGEFVGCAHKKPAAVLDLYATKGRSSNKLIREELVT